jgi:hypothetical protein
MLEDWAVVVTVENNTMLTLPGIEPELLLGEAGDQPSETWHALKRRRLICTVFKDSVRTAQ